MSAHKGKIVIELQRPYPLLALAALMFLGCGWFFIHDAETNDRGLVINGLIHLGTDGADTFYVVMAVLSIAMGVMGVVGIVSLAVRKDFRVVLGKKGITLPYGPVWRQRNEKVPYDAIVGVSLHPAGKPSMLHIETKSGRRYITARYLPTEWSLQAVADELVGRWRSHQPRPLV